MGKRKFVKDSEELSVSKNKWSKGKKRGNKRDSFKLSSGHKGAKINDIAWHTKNATTVQDLMSYPFNVLVGNTFQFTKGMNVGNRDVLSCGYASVQSVDVDWYLGISPDGDKNSTINLSSANLYTFMRQHQSGSTNYQDNDLWTSVFAGTIDIIANIAYIDKIFGLVSDYSNRNRLRPKTLFSTMNLHYQDVVNNLANYRARFNTILAKATSLVMPKDYPIVDQIVSIYKDIHIDIDSDTGREQIINVVKPVHHIYDPTGDPNGGMVRLMTPKDLQASSTATGALYTGYMEKVPADSFKPFDVTNATITGSIYLRSLLDILDTQINALISDDDYNTMAGDIMKAFEKFGKGDFWSFQPLERDHQINIGYSEEFNMMYHNAAVLPHASGYAEISVAGNPMGKVDGYSSILKQNNNSDLYTSWTLRANFTDPVLAYAQKGHEMDLLIDSNKVNPTPEDVLLMTRWQNRYNVTVSVPSGGTTNVDFTPKAMSSLIFMNARIWYNVEYKGSGGTMLTGFYHCPLLQFINAGWIKNSPPAILQHMFANGFISYIDILDQATVSNTLAEQWMVGRDLNNAVSMDSNTLQRANEVDFMSLLNVPFSGSF